MCAIQYPKKTQNVRLGHCINKKDLYHISTSLYPYKTNCVRLGHWVWLKADADKSYGFGYFIGIAIPFNVYWV